MEYYKFAIANPLIKETCVSTKMGCVPIQPKLASGNCLDARMKAESRENARIALDKKGQKS